MITLFRRRKRPGPPALAVPARLVPLTERQILERLAVETARRNDPYAAALAMFVTREDQP